MRPVRVRSAAAIAALTAFAVTSMGVPIAGIALPRFFAATLAAFHGAPTGALGKMTTDGVWASKPPAFDPVPGEGGWFGAASPTSEPVSARDPAETSAASATGNGVSAMPSGDAPFTASGGGPAGGVSAGGRGAGGSPLRGRASARDAVVPSDTAGFADAVHPTVVPETDPTKLDRDGSNDGIEAIALPGDGASAPDAGQRFVVGDTGLPAGLATGGPGRVDATSIASSPILDGADPMVAGAAAADATVGGSSFLRETVGSNALPALFLAPATVLSPAVVPEPDAVAILVFGLGALALWRRRRPLAPARRSRV